MTKILVIGGAVISFAILVLGVYFITNENTEVDLVVAKSKLQGDLAAAKNKLNKEKETLNNLKKGVQDSFPLATNVQEQMKKAADVVKRTDFFFINPNGSNPQLIVKNLLKSILINKERRDINLLLSEWSKKTSINSVREIDINESEKIRKDTEIIKTFLEDLFELVESLTPENSGLSQLEIDTYAMKLPSVNEINEVLLSLGVAIENSNSSNTQGSAIGSENDASDEGNVNSESGQTYPSSTPYTYTPSVSPEDFIVQETVVTQAQTEVDTLQEQLAQVEQEIAQSSSPMVVPTSTSPEAPTLPDPEDQIIDSGGNIDLWTMPVRDLSPYQGGIIIQPGPPRLIQGTDQY